jgi:hypothetical protein
MGSLITAAARALWHGTWEGDESDVRRFDPRTGEVLERLEMPPGVGVSGLESDGGARRLLITSLSRTMGRRGASPSLLDNCPLLLWWA